MTPTKKQLLKIAYQRVLAVTLIDMKAPLKWADEYVSESITGFGTAADEKVFSKKDYRTIVINSRKQAKGLAFKFELKTKYNPKFTGENTACFFDEFVVTVGKGSRRMVMPVSVGLVFEFYENKWKLIGLYASKIDTDTSSEDTFHLREAEKKMQELQLEVAARTEELSRKNNELKIEAALERVRAIAMSMNKAADMLLICKAISEQLKILGVKEIRNVQTAIFYESKGTYMNYEYYAKHNKTFITGVEYKKHKIQLAFAQKMMKGPSEEFVEQMKGKKLQDWYAYQKTTNQFADKYLVKAHSLNYYWFSLGPVALGISTYYPLRKEETDLFKRFLKVFELAYRCYLDIEQATAQAREAQIQLALERVRAKSLAMHHTSELQQVIHTVHSELINLEISIVGGSFIVINSDIKNELRCWGSGGTANTSEEVWVPDFKMRFCTDLIKGIKKGPGFFSEEFSQQEKINYFKKLFQQKPWSEISAEQKKETLLTSGGYTRSVVVSKYTSIFIINHHGKKFTDEENSILKRVANVFEQAYTRFLDLQKVEAQAIEAQIEAALERVRAKSMAMQQPNELREVAELLRKEMGALGIEALETSSIYLVHPTITECWYAIKDVRQKNAKLLSDYMEIQLSETWVGREMQKFYKGRQKQASIVMKGNHRKEWINYCAGKSSGLKNYYGKEIPERTYHVLKFAGGYMGAVSPGELSSENWDVLGRATTVFALAYTRFKDLQESANRAREAQIELALERVRAKSMAMHKSDELKEVIKVVLEQLVHLNIKAEHAGFYIDYKAHDDMHIWLADPNIDPFYAVLPYFDSPTWKSFLDAKTTGKSFYTDLLDYKAKNKFYKSLFNIFNVPEEAQQFYLKCKGLAVSTVLLENVGLYIENFSAIPYTEEENKILMRFAKVFEQSYTRFLDLQKAEAQAREANIEAALERVRAAMMAMHHSEGLPDIMKVILEQLIHLNIQLDVVFFHPTKNERDWNLWTASTAGAYPIKVYIPYFDNPAFNQFYEGMQQGSEFNTILLSEIETKQFWKHFFKTSNTRESMTKERKAFLLSTTGWAQSIAYKKNATISITRYASIPFSPEDNAILKRFAAVFEQSYTRFLDLQKAEAQARESEIQLALERVRSRAMAMQSSEELKVLIATVFSELTKLDLALTRCIIWVFESTTKAARWWMANSEEPSNPMSVYLKYHEHPAYLHFVNGWENQNIKFIYDLKGKDKISWDDILFNETELKLLPEVIKNGMRAPERVLLSASFNNFGGINVASIDPLSDEHFDILLRFAKVFDLTYTRFLDLQKAEAQAREAQIEAALERVRSRSLAMHKSDELQQVVTTLFDQLHFLNIENDATGIVIFKPDTNHFQYWFANAERSISSYFLLEYKKFSFTNELSIAHQSGEAYFHKIYSKEEKNEFYTRILTETDFTRLSDERKKPILESEGFTILAPLNKNTALQLNRYYKKSFSDIDIEVARRFGNVFEQAYTRFLDLQRAEAQAREAQIEAALERVRSKAMAMHNSSDLPATAIIAFSELKKLGFVPIRGGISIQNKENKKNLLYSATTTEQGDNLSIVGWALLDNHPVLIEIYNHWMKGEDYYPELHGELLKSYYEQVSTSFNVPAEQTAIDQYGYFMYFTHGVFYGWCNQPVTEEEKKLLKRFTSVIDLTFKRYFDLQKAEEQAREAQIETALERVRSRTMAMQNSNELSATVQVMFEECRKLQPTATDSLSRGFITTINQNKKMFDLWITEIDGTKIDTQFKISFDEPTTGMHIHKAWKQKKPYFINDLQGPVLDQWLDYLESTGFKIAPGIRGTRRVNTFIFYSNGFIGITSSVPLEEKNIQILQRFAKVFDQTYTRFLDLQKAEAAAKEAIKQAALDRIRADIASMRTIEDLNRITPLIWNELTILGVPFIRCGVFIMDEEVEQIHTFLSTPDGKSIAAFHLSFTESENIINIVSHWRNKKVYSNHWDEKDFDELADSLVKQTAITDKAGYLQSIPATGIHLNFLPFLQGMLYVGNELPLMPDDIHLLQAVADAFSTAYARYEDFNKLEMAKQVVEKTLNELKSTQQQLIQSEKMASLGELTAGIAHEIQNPLNFVNNFSELNNELLQELGPLDKLGVTADQQDILKDIQSNSEKINHHGQRAASIVKGMLQHSRSSSGQKEPTDINALCDEYLRLAYHGLRAKDKSFNAEFKTEFDETLPKVNIVPQDMGRVILNLINNAFFAVSERVKIEGGSHKAEAISSEEEGIPSGLQLTPYSPIVTVSTKNLGNKIEINISDNGTGIPNDIKEKIFQPFFTTKPTGQGTGLGLSLAYDIVTKLHGGKLTVESEQGSGTTFIISIPS